MGGASRVTATLRALLGALVLATLAGCFAQADPDAPAPSPLLYEITGPGGEVEGWMLGTIHLLPDDVPWRTEAIDSVVEKADLLVVEIAELEDRVAIAQLFVALGTTHGQPDLAERVPARQRNHLRAMIERGGYSPEDFRAIETWAAALMLAQVHSVGDPANGVDRVVTREFANREVREFEGPRAQLAIFDRLAEEDQRVLLGSAIMDRETARAEAQALLKAWLTGDEAAILEAATTGAMADREVREALLVGRNRAWLPRLETLLHQRERPLVAVGAAHLVGPDGLAALLERRGYTVRRLTH